jgi:hypothetical protein
MINFQTDKIILIFFPVGAGGKFLANAIGLSDNALFQDSELVKKQLENNFSSKNKIDFLLNKISNVTNQWNDLNLGCFELFGVNYHYLNLNKSFIDLDKNSLDFNPIVKQISNLDKYFFKCVHTYKDLESEINIWPNAKIIKFYNFEKFKKHYRNASNSYSDLRGDHWPISYPDLQEFLKLPKKYQDEIKSFFIEFNVDKNINFDSQVIYNWDVNNYFSFEKTYLGIKEIYKILGLNDLDKEMLKVYYTSWINKIDQLRKKD